MIIVLIICILVSSSFSLSASSSSSTTATTTTTTRLYSRHLDPPDHGNIPTEASNVTFTDYDLDETELAGVVEWLPPPRTDALTVSWLPSKSSAMWGEVVGGAKCEVVNSWQVSSSHKSFLLVLTQSSYS